MYYIIINTNQNNRYKELETLEGMSDGNYRTEGIMIKLVDMDGNDQPSLYYEKIIHIAPWRDEGSIDTTNKRNVTHAHIIVGRGEIISLLHKIQMIWINSSVADSVSSNVPRDNSSTHSKKLLSVIVGDAEWIDRGLGRSMQMTPERQHQYDSIVRIIEEF